MTEVDKIRLEWRRNLRNLEHFVKKKDQKAVTAKVFVALNQWQRATTVKRDELNASFIDGLSHITIGALFSGETRLAEMVEEYDDTWVTVDSLDFSAARADKGLMAYLKEDCLFDIFLDKEWYPATALALLALIHHKGKILTRKLF